MSKNGQKNGGEKSRFAGRSTKLTVATCAGVRTSRPKGSAPAPLGPESGATSEDIEEHRQQREPISNKRRGSRHV